MVLMAIKHIYHTHTRTRTHARMHTHRHASRLREWEGMRGEAVWKTIRQIHIGGGGGGSVYFTFYFNRSPFESALRGQ